MYLKQFEIKNFRAIKSLTLVFNKGVNVLIGENNTGKTAIIDALRICLGYGKQIREIGVKPSDFYIDRDTPVETIPEIEFHLYFEIEEKDQDKKESRYFLELIHQDKNNPNHQEIQLHFKYHIEKKEDKDNVRWEVWGGTYENQAVPSEPLQLLGYTYLDALRDATQKLRPYSQNNKLASLFENLIEYQNNDGTIKLDKDKKKELANKLIQWLKDEKDEYENDWKYIIRGAEQKVKEHLTESSFEDEKTTVEIGFSGYNYKDIVGNLQISIPLFDEDELKIKEIEQIYFTLYQNGLGENNLIYAATILGDLINRKETGHYHALLIEEPEAHLHPQKQNTFFNYLNALSNKNIQIFITSHSPTITAKTDLDLVTVLKKQKGDVKAVAIRDIQSLTKENKEYLKKFLDVTKSQLFFAKSVILVEGISEALLLPVFSRIMEYNDNLGKDENTHRKYSLEKRGNEIVIVNGVAFEHFANLFIAKDDGKMDMLSGHCSVITDDDSHKNNGNISDRTKKAMDELNNKGNVKVFPANKTFEYEIFVASENNRKIIRKIYEELHPNTYLKIDGSIEEQFFDLYNSRLEKCKADFALRLAKYMEEKYDEIKIEFIVPNYIKEAIKWAIDVQ